MTRTTWGWVGMGCRMVTLLLNHFETGDLHFRISGPIFDTDTDFQLKLTTLLGRGMGVVKGCFFGSRDHDFWISPQVLPTGTDFWPNLATFQF